MKKAIATKWVNALRSGKYTQTQNCLYDGEGYCCLGVLCDVLGKQFKLSAADDEDIFVVEGSFNAETLPPEVRREAGVKDENGSIYFTENKEAIILSKLNDDGVPFEEIANVIEQNWKRL